MQGILGREQNTLVSEVEVTLACFDKGAGYSLSSSMCHITQSSLWVAAGNVAARNVVGGNEAAGNAVGNVAAGNVQQQLEMWWWGTRAHGGRLKAAELAALGLQLYNEWSTRGLQLYGATFCGGLIALL